MSKKLPFEDFNTRVQKAYNGTISIVEETYIDIRHCVTAYCNIHKVYFVRKAYNLAIGKAKCPECHKEIKKSPKTSWDIMLKRFIKKYGYKFSYDEKTYAGYKKEMTVHCNDCNETFSITPEHHLKYNNGGCPNCQKTKIIKCSICGKEIEVDRCVSANNNVCCESCRKLIKRMKKNKR